MMKALDEASFNMRYVPADEQVEFIVTMPKDNVWFGIALGGDGSMARDTDMAVFFAAEADSTFGDYVSVGRGAPNEDRS